MIDVIASVVLGTATGVAAVGLGGLVGYHATRAGRLELDRDRVTLDRDRQETAADGLAEDNASLSRRIRHLEGQLRDRYGEDAVRQAREAAAAADTQVIHVDADPTRRIVPPARRPDAAVGATPVVPPVSETTQTWPMGWPAVNGVQLGGPQ